MVIFQCIQKFVDMQRMCYYSNSPMVASVADWNEPVDNHLITELLPTPLLPRYTTCCHANNINSDTREAIQTITLYTCDGGLADGDGSSATGDKVFGVAPIFDV